MKRTASGGAVRRRLTWAQLGSSQDSDDELKCSKDVVHGSPAHAVLCAEPLAPASPIPAAVVQLQAAAGEDGRAGLNSPIIDGAVFLDGRRKARVLFQPSSAAAAAPSEQQQGQVHGSPLPAPPLREDDDGQKQQQRPQDSIQDPAVLQCQEALAAAGSSSKGCLDLLCWSVALEQQQHLADSPTTPAAPSYAALPSPPRKCSARRRSVRAGGVLQPCRAARVLPGLAPASEADLQHVRAWLACQQA